MSLLRRIESARPAADWTGTAAPTAPNAPDQSPARASDGQAKSHSTPPAGGAPTAPPPPTSAAGGLGSGRMLAQVPLRESFRDAKFRIQQRVISDLDPKLDLANQVEVRREIDEAFGRALDAE